MSGLFRHLPETAPGVFPSLCEARFFILFASIRPDQIPPLEIGADVMFFSPSTSE